MNQGTSQSSHYETDRQTDQGKIDPPEEQAFFPSFLPSFLTNTHHTPKSVLPSIHLSQLPPSNIRQSHLNSVASLSTSSSHLQISTKTYFNTPTPDIVICLIEIPSWLRKPPTSEYVLAVYNMEFAVARHVITVFP